MCWQQSLLRAIYAFLYLKNLFRAVTIRPFFSYNGTGEKSGALFSCLIKDGGSRELLPPKTAGGRPL